MFLYGADLKMEMGFSKRRQYNLHLCGTITQTQDSH